MMFSPFFFLRLFSCANREVGYESLIEATLSKKNVKF